MDNIIRKLYKDYGQHVNSARAFPLEIDGLKPVERRILLTCYMLTKDKFVKCAKIDGTTIANFHPHASIYGTLVQLVHQGFLDAQGNFGCNFGASPIGPAAMRYTETRLSSFIREIAFKYIKHTIWNLNDLGEKEPDYLPSMLPLCLCGNEYTSGIGFGYHTLIPCFKIKDLYKRLLWLIKEKKGKEPIIKPISNCTVTASNQDLKTLLTAGKAQISIEGVFEEIPSLNKVILKSWPPNKRFESILGKFIKELDNQDIGFTDLSVLSTKIVFQVLKQRNRDLIYKNFILKLKEVVKGKINFETNVVDSNQNVKLKSIDDMLLDTYKMFFNINKKTLNYEISKLQLLIEEYQILEKIKPSLSVILKDKLEGEKAIQEISIQSGIDKDNIKKLISKYSISKLLKLKTDITELNNQISNIFTNLNNLESFVINQYSEVLKGEKNV